MRPIGVRLILADAAPVGQYHLDHYKVKEITMANSEKKGSAKELIKHKVEGGRRVLDATKLRSVLDVS